ncbi:unnamed protein product [Tenebrio molitor]|nr:unnamed protein product [Tenebrio molitor]
MGEFYRTHAVSLGYGFSQALGVARRGGILSRKKSPVRREDRPRYLSSLAEEVNEWGNRKGRLRYLSYFRSIVENSTPEPCKMEALVLVQRKIEHVPF